MVIIYYLIFYKHLLHLDKPVCSYIVTANNNNNNNNNDNDNNDKKEAIVDPSGTSTDPATQLIAELTKSPDNVYGQTEVSGNPQNSPQEQNLA